MIEETLPLPAADAALVVVPAPASGPGNWAGGAAAVLHEGTFWLAYRVRRPLGEGRGVSVIVARSAGGVEFEPVAEVRREAFGAASFERPALVPVPGGGWRLYLSCATPGSKHWWIEALDAATPEELPTGRRTVVLPGSDTAAVKDPVIVVDDAGWRMWVCRHPLADAGHEDRMETDYATSDDGLSWRVHGPVLTGSAGRWDQRGARVTAVLRADPLTVLYDGRPDAASNWHEQTGLAVASNGRLSAVGESAVVRSPHSDGALRYAAAVPLPDGRTRFYFELARPDGAHDLVTSVA